MKLSIYSLTKIIFAGEARLLNCNTVSGQITILNNHETYLTQLAEGVLRVVDAKEQEHRFHAVSGFLEVRPGNEVRCLVE